MKKGRKTTNLSKTELDTIQSNLSFSYLHAVVSRVGGSCIRSDKTADDMGIDVDLKFQGAFSFKPAFGRITIEVQLKSTRQPLTSIDGKISYRLKSEQYRKYIQNSTEEFLLILFVLPDKLESWLEEDELRDGESIIRQMITPDADVLRYRIQSSQAESGTLSLASIRGLVSSVIGSLSAAVCDVFSPGRLHHSKTVTKQVKRLLDKAQFGQTEHGSFVIKVVAPLDNLEDDSTFFPDMCDGGMRQGIVHLLKSVSNVVGAIERGTTKKFIKNGLAHPPKVSENPIEFFSGFVIELCGETNEAGNKYGDVIVQLTRSDGESFPATIGLSEKLHETAIRGYEKNIPVYLSGRLIWESGRKKQIRDVGFFQLCAADTD